MQETWIYINCKHRQHEDSKPILGNGKRNCRQNHKAFAPNGTKQEVGQHHSGDQQHQARANTAALLCNLNVSPGIVSRRPSSVTGTPAIAKNRLAAYAEPCCKKLTMWVNANPGKGTSNSKKHRGKTYIREIRVPKQQTNDPIHHVTTANMPRKSCIPTGRLAGPPPATPDDADDANQNGWDQQSQTGTEIRFGLRLS